MSRATPAKRAPAKRAPAKGKRGGGARKNSRPTPRALKQAGRSRRSGPTIWIVLGLVFVVGGALIVATVAGKSTASSSSGTRTPVPAAVLSKVTSVPDTVAAQVGGGSAKAPQPITAPALTSDGKPLVQYIGAEYCPYCAAERWGLVIALSRFGNFSGLQTTNSSTTDVFPDTPTFSFHGATYSSPYLAFDSVELQTNQPSGSTYATLETPTAAQQKLMATYDAPPFVDSSSQGAIPFVDIGGKYLISGASYDPGTLQGKTASQIAALLTDPTSPATQGIVGTANNITAALCNITGNQPATACSNSTITAIQNQLQ